MDSCDTTSPAETTNMGTPPSQIQSFHDIFSKLQVIGDEYTTLRNDIFADLEGIQYSKANKHPGDLTKNQAKRLKRNIDVSRFNVSRFRESCLLYTSHTPQAARPSAKMSWLKRDLEFLERLGAEKRPKEDSEREAGKFMDAAEEAEMGDAWVKERKDDEIMALLKLLVKSEMRGASGNKLSDGEVFRLLRKMMD